MNWNRNKSLVSQVANWLRNEVIQGRMEAGKQLPSEQELCEMLNVSRGTLRNAFMTLEREGIIVRRQGVGTFLRVRPLLRNNLSLISGTTDMIRSMGMVPGISEISIKEEMVNFEVAEFLNLGSEDTVICIDRIQTANAQNVVVTTDYFPKFLLKSYPGGIPSLSSIKQYILEHISLYHLLEEGLGLKTNHSFSELRPMNAPEEISKKLGLNIGDAVMYIKQVDYDIEETPLLYSSEYHAGEASIFTVNKQRA